jgi:hypothetical protein
MKAYKFLTKTTDFARVGLLPVINCIDEGIYADLDDFIFECFIRFTGIKERYPEAIFSNLGTSAQVSVGGAVVYVAQVLAIDPEPIEVEDDDEDDAEEGE